jgi:hypothetical protein
VAFAAGEGAADAGSVGCDTTVGAARAPPGVAVLTGRGEGKGVGFGAVGESSGAFADASGAAVGAGFG